MAQLDIPLRPEEKAAEPQTVCVTGATGYVAGHIVARLLAAGHTVHATARNPGNAKSVAHLASLPGAAERLKLFKADLLQEGCFDEALVGCSAVMHTASPYFLDCPPGKEDEMLIGPAIRGTENVLNSVNRAPGVKRVLVTSSVVGVWGDPNERGKGHVFTEDDWNKVAHPKKYPYFYAKMMAERRAFEMEQEAAGRWSLVTLNPGVVWGPPIGNRADGESIEQMIDLLSGAFWPWAPPLGAGVVDVRDVALAHCLALVKESAKGRFLLVNQERGWYLLPDAARILRRSGAYGRAWLPPLLPDYYGLIALGPIMGCPVPITKATYKKRPLVSTAKAARELGITEWIPMQRSVLDMAADLTKKGMVPAWKLPVAWPVLAVAGGVVAWLVYVLGGRLGLF
ncbi:heme peroxidase-related protein [Monoraphidium neglectum]|uniref:Flavanone 4-reductase n=1 Tax=Monoraphidium neglectum TaxID=145388 RepID=A0A0D2MIK1_9CHLO|nr:heme peroxidase-related protein [Monoraphidium neglectum]KIZ02870.1 heme peroxidase-related protein [Monoraphidium neglectum]|eukprot:XP_013901889.1 heme peroxidase-related protein [Monoraphidium neglectum]